ncbi:hypothetical protein [Cognatishimia sp. F0-27]|nr:hypothetical protein [Cognatishimia sp. F0-27]
MRDYRTTNAQGDLVIGFENGSITLVDIPDSDDPAGSVNRF